MTTTTPEYLRRAFLHFEEMCRDESPLYAHLSLRIADAPDLLALAAHAQPRQPAVNLLLGAVHFLLLSGVAHPLSAYYPSLGGDGRPADAWPAFVDFCSRHAATLADQVGRRRVQTNEIGRCGLLMPAFALAAARLGGPLHLVEVGASAGLNLLFDRYRYDYGDHGRVGDGPVVIRTEVRGAGTLPVPSGLPFVADRIGVDIAPVDLGDDDAMRWVEALIWPEHLDRLALQRGAVPIARREPPRMIAGDALDHAPELAAATPDTAVPLVYHSHATYQMTGEWRARLDARLDAVGQSRPLAHVALEWLADEPGPQLRVALWGDGRPTRLHLAACHHHGRWIEPRPEFAANHP